MRWSKRVGVLGGGQLAMMLKEAADKLGVELVCYENKKKCSASHVTDVVVGDFLDEKKLSQFVESCDVVTFETENIPHKTVEFLKIYSAIYPSPEIILIAQDRLYEKEYVQALEIPVAPYFSLAEEKDFGKLTEKFSFPAILKTRTGGYDGKGQMVVKNSSDLKAAWHVLDRWPTILETKIDFEREVSLLAARNRDGEMVFYPLVENFHHKGIIRLTRAPYPSRGGESREIPEIELRARDYLKRIMEKSQYVGLLAVEFFIDKKGNLIFNEMAPRVHNSGHWGINGASVDQFEQHLRAILNMALIPPKVLFPTVMVNWIGELGHYKMKNRGQIDEMQLFHFDYKKEVIPHRKVGHTNIIFKNSEICDDFYQSSVQKFFPSDL